MIIMNIRITQNKEFPLSNKKKKKKYQIYGSLSKHWSVVFKVRWKRKQDKRIHETSINAEESQGVWKGL